METAAATTAIRPGRWNAVPESIELMRCALSTKMTMATPSSAIDNLRRTHAFGPAQRADIGEIDEGLWLTPAEARKKLSHSTDMDILALFVHLLQEGALDSLTVIILCHG